MATAAPAFVLEYQVAEADFVEAYLAHRKSIRRDHYLLPVVGSLCLALGVWMGLVARRWSPSLVFLVSSFIVFGLFLIGSTIFLRLWLKRLYGKDPRSGAAIRIVIEGDEWIVRTAMTEARFKRGTFIQALETDSMLLFYYSPIAFAIIPKRVLTQEQLAQLHEFMDRVFPFRDGQLHLPTAA